MKRVLTAREQYELLSPWRTDMPESRSDRTAAVHNQLMQICAMADTTPWHPFIESDQESESRHGRGKDKSYFIGNPDPGRITDQPIAQLEVTLHNKGDKRWQNAEPGRPSGHYPREHNEAYINSIIVHPDFQGQGIAQALIERLNSDHPEYKINPGVTTPKGTGLVQRLKKIIPDSEEKISPDYKPYVMDDGESAEYEKSEYANVGHDDYEYDDYTSEYNPRKPTENPTLQDLYATAFGEEPRSQQTVRASLERTATEKLGDCYEAAGRHIIHDHLHNPNSTVRLVHGEVAMQGPHLGKTMGHAWIEDGDNVFDPSNGGNLRMPKNEYYSLGKINELNNFHSYSPKEAAQQMVELQHFGPWHLTVNGEAPPGRMEIDDEDEYDDDDYYDDSEGLGKKAGISDQPDDVTNDYTLAEFYQWCARNRRRPNQHSLNEYTQVSGMSLQNYQDIWRFLGDNQDLRTAGANGEMPDLDYKWYGVHPFLGDNWFEAHHDGKTVARLYWNTDKHPRPGEISLMQVHPDYRRRGIATDMVNTVREEIDPNIQFSSSVSPDGKAWSKANGYKPPKGESWQNLKRRNDASEWRE